MKSSEAMILAVMNAKPEKLWTSTESEPVTSRATQAQETFKSCLKFTLLWCTLIAAVKLQDTSSDIKRKAH